MMHNEMNDGPKPPEGSGRAGRVRSAAEEAKASGLLTTPTLECLSDEDRKKMAAGVVELLDSMQPSAPQTVFDAALDNFSAMGAHLVGHALNGMIWSGVQAALLNQGQQPRDIPDAMVVIEIDAEATEAHRLAADMVSEMTQATMAGAHASAMEAWSSFVDQVGDDWDMYFMGISAALHQVLFLAHAVLDRDESASEVMGREVYAFRLHDCDRDHPEG